MSTWEDRFRAPRISLPDWARDAPDRCVYTGNVTGTFELYTWDRNTGEHRQATSRVNGTTDGFHGPDRRPGRGGSLGPGVSTRPSGLLTTRSKRVPLALDMAEC